MTCDTRKTRLCFGVPVGSAAVLLSQGVVGENTPEVPPPRGEAFSLVRPGGGADVDVEHEKGISQHAPDLQHKVQTLRNGGEICSCWIGVLPSTKVHSPIILNGRLVAWHQRHFVGASDQYSSSLALVSFRVPRESSAFHLQ